MLAAYFGTDEVAFSTISDAMQGFSRSFHSFSEAAAEAGISRIFGGIHFMSANQQGLASGARLATYVSDNFLKARPSMAAAMSQPAQAQVAPPLPALPSAPPDATPLPARMEPTPPILPAGGRRIVATGGQEQATDDTQ